MSLILDKVSVLIAKKAGTVPQPQQYPSDSTIILDSEIEKIRIMNDPGEVKLSEHFYLWQLTDSNVAFANGILNDTNAEQNRNLSKLCMYVLDPIYEQFYGIEVTSGFRCKALNEAVHGSYTSQHMDGLAADIISQNATKEEIYSYVVHSDIPYDQVIIYDRMDIVHVSYSDNPRKQALKL